MCGIAGFLGFEDKALLKRMTGALKHRGPDAEGFYTDKNVSLGHRRLAIIDLDARSNQPMENEDRSIQTVFNGEIYNFGELRPELKKKGHKFKTESDTEVIVHGYEAWGESCVKRFGGMFAFAVWDSKKKKLFLARDRIGVKPLYYYFDNEKFIFASEIKAILEVEFIKREVNIPAFYHYLTYINTPAPETLFKGVYKLEAGHTLSVSLGKKIEIKKEKYWDIADVKINPEITEEEAIKKVRFLLEDSMRQRMISDVPQGVFLSGGLDSSTLVALMSERSNEPVNTFSIATGEDEKYNELKYAKIVAEKFGTNHHEYHLQYDEVIKSLPNLVYHEDEPIADPVNIPVYYLSKYARKENVLVLQMGEGSDELFCGYPIYGVEAKSSAYSSILRGIPPARVAANLAISAANAIKKKQFFAQAEDHLKSMNKVGEFPRRGILGFTEIEKKGILSNDTREKTQSLDSYDLFRDISRRIEGSGKDAFLQKVRTIELKNRLPELLLMRVDKFTMAASIEAREPFLDYKLAEYAFSIPPYSLHMKNGVSKYILKKAIGDKLPAEIVNRKKIGFGVPIADHFAGELKGFAESEIETPEMSRFFNINSARKIISGHSHAWDNSFRIWVLLNFALWHKYWIQGEKIKI